ncbi:LuxR C-terminal-related transcriptional regulator [Dictyobacter aurantiacus]|uniref:LuxR family transcriptional regulator n=1 Tax=Dictyobacter aurantiacus TaxID=1936993 RepID=A0A401ZJN4_9CHLR|nr:LuxR C-terminal-related transcriptional regulator [Dictyobacter aurantiacus]GCE07040.1 LuxR family transcriptional regulator [Dictyobacter aurantiacus]
MLESDLLLTRFTIPPRRAALLTRPQLLAALDQSRAVPVTLLLASAGSGKTTLLSAWASQCGDPVAWLSLDELDTTPARFWSYVVAALRKAGLRVGETTLALLHAPQAPPLNNVLTALINELSMLAQDAVLIIDDYHVVSEPAIHESLRFFLEHLPPCLHLVMASRVDPPLPLARLRARGQLVEIGEADLRLSADETANFLTHVMGLALSTEEMCLLEQRTEGWLAGLQLAGLSLRRNNRGAVFSKVFAGSHRFILDYVQEEVLAPLPEEQQRFLLQTSVLDRLNADLCQAVTGLQTSQQMLEELERAHLFLVALDEERYWYRFHLLFREVLQARLQAVWPERVARLQREAALWYQHQCMPHEALRHAQLSRDPFFVADLLEDYSERLFLQGELQMLLTWIKQLPDEVLFAHPRLATSYVLAFNLLFPFPHQQQSEQAYLSHLQQGVEALLQSESPASLSPAERDLLRHRLTVLRVWNMGVKALSDGDVERLNNFAESLQQLPQEDDAVWRQHTLGSLAMASRLAGNFPPIVAALQEEWKNPWSEQHGSQAVPTLWGLIVALIALGQLEQARDYSEILRQLIEKLGVPAPLSAYPDSFQAQLAYERDQLEDAKSAALRAIEVTAPLQYMDILVEAYDVLARACLAQGDLAGAEHALRALEQVNRAASIPLFLPWVESLQVHLWLARGELAPALDWAEHTAYRHETPFYSRERVYLALVLVYLACGHYQRALCMLTTLLRAAEPVARKGSVIAILALQVAVLQASGATQDALNALSRLLAAAESEGYRRVFLDAGEPMRQALLAFLDSAHRPPTASPAQVAYARTLLASFAAAQQPITPSAIALPPTASSLPEPLTAREQDVLNLLAQGASNHEIAERLVISLTTVKKHVGNLMLKLAAENRTHAVARARELSLL